MGGQSVPSLSRPLIESAAPVRIQCRSSEFDPCILPSCGRVLIRLLSDFPEPSAYTPKTLSVESEFSGLARLCPNRIGAGKGARRGATILPTSNIYSIYNDTFFAGDPARSACFFPLPRLEPPRLDSKIIGAASISLLARDPPRIDVQSARGGLLFHSFHSPDPCRAAVS